MAVARQYETDVAIIGAGGAGMAAGIEARDAGARVIAFEKASELGGAAIISGGGCLIVGSELQKQHGIEDTPDLAFKDWIEWGGPSADAVWARYYIEHTLHDLYRWSEGLGVKWVDLKFQEGNSVMRWTRAERNGLGLMTHLIDAFRRKGGEIVPDTEITGLAIDERPRHRARGPRRQDRRAGDRSRARPSWWRPAASTRTSTWCSSSIRGCATTRCWKARAAARPAPGTGSRARPAAISRTWTTSGSTSTRRPTTAIPSSAAAWCSAWCPATSGSTSRAAASTTRRCRAATRRARRCWRRARAMPGRSWTRR